MSTASSSAIAPFLESRSSRQLYHDRTLALLSTLAATSSPQTTSLLTLPNHPTHSSERRSTSTFLLRPPSSEELSVLLDPSLCNCRLVNPNVEIRLMYRVAGNGEGKSMAKWDLSAALKEQVRNNGFGGEWLILGVLLDGPDDATTTTATASSSAASALSNVAGLSNNTLLSECILEPGSSLHDNSEVSRTHVMKHASIVGCGSVTCPRSVVEASRKKCRFDMQRGSMDVEVGPEAGGGRLVRVCVESTLVDVCRDLNMDSGVTLAPLVPQPPTPKNDDVPAIPMNSLAPRSSLLHTPTAAHVALLPHSTIRSAQSVLSALLLPHAAISWGVTASHALLQWDATLTSHSDAHRVFLMERSEVGPHSFTANAIYGADAHVSGGEVHCTVFGPNANGHHQSLLIGILWPLGRGNVGYGSNVGSNHTGRIPDQETSVGEGTFWGLGSVIKFPVDLTHAPYSIVAAGVQLPPQRITLPFSLITDGPNNMNLLTPGWLLHYSPYTIARSEVKFANRRMAKRHDFYTGWKILRAGVMDMLVDARESLLSVGRRQQQQQQQSGGEGTSGNRAPASAVQVYKTDKAIPGLGANQLTEKGRQIGIKAYTAAIQRYALRGLLHRLVTMAKAQDEVLSAEDVLRHVGLEGVLAVSGHDMETTTSSTSKVNWPVLPWNEEAHTDPEAQWKHQHSLLMKELPSIISSTTNTNNNNNNNISILSTLLQKCVALEQDHAKRVYQSKSRDDARGAKTVPGYADVHVAAEKDSVVLAAREEAESVKRDVAVVEEMMGIATGGGGARSRL